MCVSSVVLQSRRYCAVVRRGAPWCAVVSGVEPSGAPPCVAVSGAEPSEAEGPNYYAHSSPLLYATIFSFSQ